MEQKEKDSLSLKETAGIIKMLLGKDGCPWDKKQTPESITRYILEESYELLDAIQKNDNENVCEEIGDVLFLIMFLIELKGKSGKFQFHDIISKNSDKMVGRHPHVFINNNDSQTDLNVSNPDEALKQWNSIKRKEKGDCREKSVLDSVPLSMPPLMRAYQVSERTADLGFDWDNMDGVIEKVEEEWEEFKTAVKEGNKKEISLEFGDILFTMTNVARFAGIHPETSLAESIAKFERRYRYMEENLVQDNKTLESISRKEIDKRWDEAKRNS